MRREKMKEFFYPETIAVIGASDNPKKVGYALMKKLSGFKGEVIPINIEHDTIFGKKAYKTIADYKGKIDLVVIAIPAPAVKKVLKECGRKKLRNVIVISAGFSEVGNKKLEERLIKTAKRYRINLLGPNCFGVANPSLNLDLTFANMSAKKGDTAFISQSGALWSYIADISASKGKPGFSGFVSLGNMADLNFADFIEYFNQDEKTKRIVLYIEKIKDGKRFIEACKKSKKEIIVIKAGKSAEGKKATLSHTGSLATDYEIYRGVFKQTNIKLYDSFSSAFSIKSQKPRISKKRVAIVTNAGGAGALTADYLSEKGCSVKEIIDVIGTALAEDYEKTLKGLNIREYDSVIVILTPQTMSQPEKTAEVLSNPAFKNKITALFLGGKSVQKAKDILRKNRIPCITDI